MGSGVPQYERTIIALITDAPIGQFSASTSTVRLGGPSIEDGEGFAGVEFHLKIVPTGGTTDSGLLVDFQILYDGTTVDVGTGVGNGPPQVSIAAGDIGSSGTYHQTLNYETKDIGYAVRLLLARNGGDRTLTTSVYARRWRGKELIG